MKTIKTLIGPAGEELHLYDDYGLRIRVDRPGERAVSAPVTATQLAELAADARAFEDTPPDPVAPNP